MYQTYDHPPSFVRDALLDDLNGKVQPRLLGGLYNPIIKIK